MDNMTVKDVVLDKKLDDYGSNRNNFLAAQELSVNITLEEYRDLVSKAAISQHKIDEANSDKYNRNAENERLKKEIESLKAENYELKKQLDTLKEEKINNDTGTD